MSLFDASSLRALHPVIRRRLPHLLIRAEKSKKHSIMGALKTRSTTKSRRYIVRRLLHLEKIFALGIGKENSHLTLRVDGKTEPLTPEQFLWVIPTGSLEGYH